MTRAERSGRATQEHEPELPARLATVLDHLEEVAAAHDDEFADVLSQITPVPVDEEERPAPRRTA